MSFLIGHNSISNKLLDLSLLNFSTFKQNNIIPSETFAVLLPNVF
ncbi:hypothetical protein L289_3260 [Acinetobacter gerneri DSM 14967 = CIP 107464 = MTCC 9824]|nr:hypothetical protein L289_3260 [Acinetobacter gerneri DSM 14967 = CIP 107464 = MTCC 9824]